eukprot:TRINITY_DN26732_c0_g1_i1.p1 TRINITY_DN26732_c0_g1~~TRINITY_DN26732_c0_g1_i1.p1  ORF type:complete len:226 (+),score=53.80 TRINITY_DN26732_c0_g1_i1:44-679(+)
MMEIFLPHTVKALSTALPALEHTGVCSFPLISPEFRAALLDEAVALHRSSPPAEVETVGPFSVRQQLNVVHEFEPAAKFVQLNDAFQALLQGALDLVDRPLFDTPPRFGFRELTKYDVGSIGITPHRDPASSVNLVAVFVIGGAGRFFVCDDRDKTNSVEIDAAPGNVVLMRAPGYLPNPERPFHYITDITECRYAFILRDQAERPTWHYR